MNNTDNTLNINASEIQSIRTGTQYVKIPMVDQTTSEATVQQVNIDGHLMTCLVTYDLRGDATLIIDMSTGITYELNPVMPDATDERAIPLVTIAEKAELEKILKAS